MTKFQNSLSLAAVAALSITAVPRAGAVNVPTFDATLSATAAAPTGAVVASNLPAGGSTITSYGTTLNYYTNNYGAVPGETFTTAANATAIGSLSVQLGSVGSVSGNAKATFHLVLGTVTSGGNYTPAVQYNVLTAAPTVANGDYLTFNLSTPFAVTPNTTYIYGVYSDNGTYAGPSLVTTGGTAGQQLAALIGNDSVNNAGPSIRNDTYKTYKGTDTTVTPYTAATAGADNAVFEVLAPTTAIPEPATLAVVGLGFAGVALRRKRKLACAR